MIKNTPAPNFQLENLAILKTCDNNQLLQLKGLMKQKSSVLSVQNALEFSDEAMSELSSTFEQVVMELMCIRSDLCLQNEFNKWRAEILNTAVQSISEKVLIEKLISLIGNGLALQCIEFIPRICGVQQKRIVWSGDAFGATKDNVFPVSELQTFLGKEHYISEFNSVEPNTALLNYLFNRFNIGSFLVIPYGDVLNPNGFLIFYDCRKKLKCNEREICFLKELVMIAYGKSIQIRAENDRLKALVYKQQTDLILQSVMDAVIMLTGNGNIELFNNAAELLTGYCEYEIRGKCFSELITIINEKTQLPFSEFIKKCSHTKRMDGCQGIMIAKDGSHKRILFHGDLVRGTSDGDEHILLVLHDITVQEKFLDENIKMRRLESISLLAGGVAQDFNAILMCITANLFKAKMIIHDSSEARALITDAERAAFRATCLTKQLLIISKNGAPVKENTSIKALIEGAVGFCLSGFSVDYCLQLPDNLWLVDIDKGQINQVLNNLLINAVEAMPDNFGLINILAENYSFECEKNQITKHLQLKNGNYVKISVIDNGNGIPPPLINKIFDPYFSTKQNGTGLGLTTAYSIIHKHGGDMSVESSPGSGTIFTFYLPVSDIQEDTGKEMLPFLKNCNGRVLIIDEDILVRMVIEKVLRGCGFNVTSISEPQEAFDFYKDALNELEPYTLIILDFSYQNRLSSEELFKKIRSIDDTVKIIALSGHSIKPFVFDSDTVEFNGILNKPFTIEALRQIINNILSEGEKVEG